jgi:hypothetical protein
VGAALRAARLWRIVMVRTYRCSVADLPSNYRERRRFPALDPEPPPLPWWRRLTMPAAVVVLAGVVVAAVLAYWPFHGVGGPGAGPPTTRRAGWRGLSPPSRLAAVFVAA